MASPHLCSFARSLAAARTHALLLLHSRHHVGFAFPLSCRQKISCQSETTKATCKRRRQPAGRCTGQLTWPKKPYSTSSPSGPEAATRRSTKVRFIAGGPRPDCRTCPDIWTDYLLIRAVPNFPLNLAFSTSRPSFRRVSLYCNRPPHLQHQRSPLSSPPPLPQHTRETFYPCTWPCPC